MQEIQSPDTPLFLTPVEDLHDGYVCVAYKNQFDLVNDKSGDVTHFYTVPVSKVMGRPIGIYPRTITCCFVSIIHNVVDLSNDGNLSIFSPI